MSDNINDTLEQNVVTNISELLAYALALEEQACERYGELAELMQTHNNKDVAELFKKMSAIEKLHVTQIRQLIIKYQLTDLPVKQYQWISLEGPESTDPGDLHYLMTARQALMLALLNEQRACEYYENVVRHSDDQDVRSLAQELATEEQEHVALVRDWLDRFPETEEDWDYDDDPPVSLD